MTNIKNGALVAGTFALALFSAADALALNSGGPAMFAWAGYYNQSEPLRAGPLCWNDPERMPWERQYEVCESPVITRTATGRYTVTAKYAQPLTDNTDAGYQVLVQAIGTNAHCYEESTTWLTSGERTLTSKIRCVAPSANASDAVDMDSEWAWSYRSDALSYPQGTAYANNFAYTRVNKDGALVANQTFNPNTDHAVTSEKLATGRYRVVFRNLYTHSYDLGNFADPGYLHNVVVQKTCHGDSVTSCRRSVCIPYSWVPGHFFPTPTGNIYDSTLEVRCYGPDGSLRDTNFRAFAGEESQVSQGSYSDSVSGGWHYGWINYVSQTSSICHDPSAFVHRSQHESALDGEENETMELCKTSTGRYMVTPLGNAVYHDDDLIPVLSSKGTGGTYCNVHQIDRHPTALDVLTVRCYNRSGAAVNASWNLSFFY